METDWLNRPIFFSVYGNMKSEVVVSFSYTYKAVKSEELKFAT